MAITLYATPGAGAAAPAQAPLEARAAASPSPRPRRSIPARAPLLRHHDRVSIAAHQNTVAQASSQASTSGSSARRWPPRAATAATRRWRPTSSRRPSRSTPATPTRRRTRTRTSVPLPAHKHASANPAPFGEAVTTDGAARTPAHQGRRRRRHGHSGLIEDGTVREAKAITDISRHHLPPGLVSLSGLHWEAVAQSPDGPQRHLHDRRRDDRRPGHPDRRPRRDARPDQRRSRAARLRDRSARHVRSKAETCIFVDPMGISVFPTRTRRARRHDPRRLAADAARTFSTRCSSRTAATPTYITIFDIAARLDHRRRLVRACSSAACRPPRASPPATRSPRRRLAVPAASRARSRDAGSGSGSAGSTASSGSTSGSDDRGVATADATPAAGRRRPRAGVVLERRRQAGRRPRGSRIGGRSPPLGLVAEGDRRKMRRAQKRSPSSRSEPRPTVATPTPATSPTRRARTSASGSGCSAATGRWRSSR